MERRGIRERGILFELPEVTVFDLLHMGFVLEEVGLERGRELAGRESAHPL